MRRKRLSANFVMLTVLTTAASAVCGGCAPTDQVDLAAFVTDLMLNAAAAFLL
jgi:hypothetical protein